jgi:hypothetical protein
MKKIILLLVMALGCIFTYAQSRVDFQLTPNGTFISKDGKGYAIINYDNQTKDQLYSEAFLAATKFHNTSESVIRNEDDKMITIHGDYKNVAKYMTMVLYFPLSAKYIVQFQFKDGKVKISAPLITSINLEGVDVDKPMLWLSQLYNEKGKPKKSRITTIEEIDKSMNSIINNILTNMENSKKDNW